MQNRIVFTVIAILLIVLGAVGCGFVGGGGDVYYSCRVNGQNHEFDHGELYRKSAFGKKKIGNVYMDCMKMLDDETVIGECNEGPGTPRYVATYNLKDGTLTRITEIGDTIEEQRVSANADLTAVYYGDEEKGIVEYDIASGETKSLIAPEELKEPLVTGDGKTMYYISKWNLIAREVGKSPSGGIIAGNVHTYVLSNDEKFIIFTRLERDYKSTLYKLDLETGEETRLEQLNKQIKSLSISSDNKKLSYVTYSNGYFSEWARTILNVYDLKSGRRKVVYKSGSFDNIESIIFW